MTRASGRWPRVLGGVCLDVRISAKVDYKTGENSVI